ncbi:ricin-type beta-trefoil lectin domain protein [Umezawaea beigongshangensis]|uniref:ricin-type beta-trefoil lectin domain protein n=1 Tax=Umezawaea beigongshangensis TaxID=2780383 RepID=UPI0027DC92D1|nr:ricin-type beta-trefoil lectin domain protein [Umezawaea beigongshangensis]
MKRRTTALTGAAALAAALIAFPITSVVASPSTSDPGVQKLDIAPEMLDAMRRDLRLTDEQIEGRLAVEAAAPVVERQVRTELGADFGGAWLPEDGRALVVGVTDPSKVDAVREAGAEPKLVEHSEERLDDLKSTLDGVAAEAGEQIHGWYVDPASNSVVVVADPAAQDSAREFAAASGAAGDEVRVVAAQGEAPRPMHDIRGGDEYVINRNTLCSVGFSVQQGGFVTAGHCGAVGSPTAGFNGVAQGTFRGSSFPGDDHGWVQTNSSWTPQPWVNNHSGGNVTVAGSQEAAVGSSVCRSGRTTGWRCGTILGKNETVRYPQGAVSGLTRSNACAEGGDSGGSWVAGNQAQGVTSGGSGNCTTGGTMYFQPIGEILSVYGLSLTTSGGGSGGGGRIIGYGGRCVDVPDSNASEGVQLQIWDCNGTGAQNWTFASDGTVRALGMCMDVAWGSRDNGASIQLARCSGSPAQQFVLSAAGDLVNPQANKCVDVKDWINASGAKLHQWECTGGANQKWRRG